MLDSKLIEAYQNTAFVVDGLKGQITLRIESVSQEIDNLLLAHGTAECAFIAAWNPRSARLQPQENCRRHSQLMETVSQLGYPYFTGRGIGKDKDWTPEESVLVIGIDGVLRWIWGVGLANTRLSSRKSREPRNCYSATSRDFKTGLTVGKSPAMDCCRSMLVFGRSTMTTVGPRPRCAASI
jgi:hypothetical protein